MIKAAAKHGISQLVYRGSAAAVVFHMLWQLDDLFTVGMYCTNLHLTKGKECISLYLQSTKYIQTCCHFNLSFLDVIAPRNTRRKVRPMRLLAAGFYFIYIPRFRCKYLPLLLEEKLDGFFERLILGNLWLCTSAIVKE
jgi:hypothetical protein